jgi:hypothetical protein
MEDLSAQQKDAYPYQQTDLAQGDKSSHRTGKEKMNSSKKINGSDKKTERADGQKSGLAGEFFVAAELLKRDIQTSVTFGNAKAIDLFAHNSVTGRNFNVQVKTLRKTNYYLFNFKRSKIDEKLVYIFVVLNAPGIPVEYFIITGHKLTKFPFSNSGGLSGIHSKSLELAKFEDKWDIFLK